LQQGQSSTKDYRVTRGQAKS